ncbi:MAG: DUF2130 domain-containing protein [Oscillospiraceae bacterium]|nr:DUF2130 domain-containing protein [Oscillospiraceae bacterium]
MNTSSIVCPHCKQSIEISDAFQHQIAEQVETLRKQYDNENREKIEQAVQKARSEERIAAEKLRHQAKDAQDNEKQLRQTQKTLLEELSQAKKAQADAELAARKELLAKEQAIREEAAKHAAEEAKTKLQEQEATIGKLREQLTDAKRVAEQGSQQLQGEVLELDIEQGLRSNFPYDTIDEVKKGERGSDIRQTVNEPFYQNCGLILWECKNVKAYQEKWLSKLREELVAEKAQVGVIVFNGGDDFKKLADNIWLVKPRYAMILAAAVREGCVKVAIANRNAQGKDVKTEMIYNYLTSGEFANRIRYIAESYDEMTNLLALEKKQTQKRWAAQEKNIQKAMSSVFGMTGDLQGIAGREILALPAIEDNDETTQEAP